MENLKAGEADPWVLRAFLAQDNYRHMSAGNDSWLEIMEKYSRCQMTYSKDKFIALTGLIKRKQNNPRSQYFNSRNFLGQWEKTLHIDLCWAKKGSVRLKYIDTLNLPTWSWMSYEGNIAFMQDGRNARDCATVKCLPTKEFKLLDVVVPEPTDPLPLSKRASITVGIKFREISKFSQDCVPPNTQRYETWDELHRNSPFDLDSRTGTLPKYLDSMTECRKIFDDRGTHIGFASFDQASRPCPDVAHYCAFIATVRNDPAPPILAHALLLTATDAGMNEYERVGIVQVNHG